MHFLKVRLCIFTFLSAHSGGVNKNVFIVLENKELDKQTAVTERFCESSYQIVFVNHFPYLFSRYLEQCKNVAKCLHNYGSFPRFPYFFQFVKAYLLLL